MSSMGCWGGTWRWDGYELESGREEDDTEGCLDPAPPVDVRGCCGCRCEPGNGVSITIEL